MKVLILGGYGAFGARIAEVLGDLAQVHLVIAGRSQAKATEFCQTYTGAPQVTPLQLDRTDIVGALQGLGLDLVIDASGPFQAYGGQGYGVVQACIAHRVPYLDLADGRDFVAGIGEFDAEARAAGIFIRSGVSSCPALTDAAVRALGQGADITRITGGIAPTPRAGLGPSVLRAVLGYAGTPITHLRGGAEVTTPGLTDLRRITIAPPGILPLHSTRFALCETPELSVLPLEHPHLQDIWFGAGTRPQVLLVALAWAARMRAALGLPSLEALAPVAHRVLRWTKWGEHRGGMFVEVEGTRDDAPFRASWHLLAEGDDGPLIPAMAVSATLRKMLDGQPPAIGAKPAVGDLDLADFAAVFEGRAVHMGQRHDLTPTAPLYARVLGAAFDAMDAPLQSLHAGAAQAVWSGEAQVTRGRNPLARLTAWLFGFPEASGQTPVTVTLTAEDGMEHWERNFDGKRFHSSQWAGTGRHAHLLMERFGPITVALGVTITDGRLDLIPRHWAILGVPLPRWARPRGACFEQGTDGAFQFDVTIGAPFIGVIVRYRGRLQQVA